MISSPARGTLTISIDVETSAGCELGARRLLDVVAKHQLPVTWGLADPTASLARDLIQTDSGHEIAIAGDPAWAGAIVCRARFGRELAIRVMAGRAGGIAISSLLLRSELGGHYDLVIKQGLTAVRHGSSDGRLRPGTPRFGLWTFGVNCWLPGAGRLWPGGGGGRAARLAIDQAISEPGCVHLAVDARALIERGGAARRTLDGVLAYAARRRSDGALHVTTLAEMARRLTAGCTSKPSRSILRPAA